MTHLVRQSPFTIDLIEFLQQKDEETGKLPDIQSSRVSILPKHLFSRSFCPRIKNLNDYCVEIQSEATLRYLIKQIQKRLEENNIQVLSLSVNPPITHLKIATHVPLETIPLLLAFLPSIRELTIPSNETLALTAIISHKNISRVNIQEKRIFFDKGEKALITRDPQMSKTCIYTGGSRYRFMYASTQYLKYMCALILGNVFLHFYHFSKILSQQIDSKREFQEELSNRQVSSQFSYINTLTFPLITLGLIIWTFLYEFERYRAHHREVIREQKIEKQQ
jgi:hypothetical protein